MKTNEFELLDYSFLTSNKTSTILFMDDYNKLFNYRAVMSMINELPSSSILETNAIDDTLLTIAEVSATLGKRCKILKQDGIKTYIFEKLKGYRNIEFVDRLYGDKYTILDIYHNPNAINGYVLLGQQVRELISDINYVVAAVDSGNTLMGLSQGVVASKIVGLALDDETIQIPKIINPRCQQYSSNFIQSYNDAADNFTWLSFGIEEIAEGWETLHNATGRRLSYVATVNLLASIEISNREEYATILTVNC